MKKLLLLIAAVALFFSSCTIEKRRYTDGYHVEWHHNHDGAYTHHQKSEVANPVTIENEAVAESVTVEKAITEESSSEEIKTQANIPTAAPNSNPVVAKSVSGYSNKIKTPTAGATGRKSHSKSIRNGQWAAQGAVNITSEQHQSNDPDTLLLIIIAIFISPLAVYLHEGSWNTNCWINLILWLLFVLPGFIHALIVILG
ncbi:MAG: YqaE/Pmp3 family membrane protein [Flavobacteriales bacterium]|nr:YqaE/Pmp3 family membrane protein [Flavobacteriales bacterium]